MRDTIFLDFDGVIRLWTGVEIKCAESNLGLESGTLFKIAFSEQLLTPAIIGVDSDEVWRGKVLEKLQSEYDLDVATELMNAWNNATYSIDFKLLKQIKSELPSCRVILTTNATSRLLQDLEASELAVYFDAIVNSYDVGFSKPRVEYFQAALSTAKRSPAKCVFVDDSLNNIIAASELGIVSELHVSSEKTIEFIVGACK